MNAWPLYLNGKWKSTQESLDVLNPFTNKIIAKVSLGNEMALDDAIAAAYLAFQKTKEMKSFERSRLCERISDLIQEHLQEFADLIIAESGKPRKFAVAEVKRAVSTFKIASEEAQRLGERV